MKIFEGNSRRRRGEEKRNRQLNHNQHYIFPSQQELLEKISEFIQKRDATILNNKMTAEEIRAQENSMLALLPKKDLPKIPLAINDHYIPIHGDNNRSNKILLRIYDPTTSKIDNNNFNKVTTKETMRSTTIIHPALIFVHGGGCVQLSVEFYDYVLRYLASSSGLIIAAMNYRLAPENPFPAGLNDIISTVRWISENGEKVGIDTDRIALGGDSAGANLALSAALVLLRNSPYYHQSQQEQALQLQPQPLEQQKQKNRTLLRALFLLYGWYSPNLLHSESMKMFGVAQRSIITKILKEWYLKNTFQNADDYKNPMAFPLLSSEFKGLPPTYIVTTGLDMFKDDSINLAKRLEQDQQEYYITIWPGVIHGALNLISITPEIRKYVDAMIAYLRGILIL